MHLFRALFLFYTGLTCIKTRRAYKTRRHSFRDDHRNEGSNESASASDKSSKDNSDTKPHMHKRRSVLRETSTSRYRSFVEKTIRQIGLNGLSQRIKSILHKTLWKARQALEVSELLTCVKLLSKQQLSDLITLTISVLGVLEGSIIFFILLVLFTNYNLSYQK